MAAGVAAMAPPLRSADLSSLGDGSEMEER